MASPMDGELKDSQMAKGQLLCCSMRTWHRWGLLQEQIWRMKIGGWIGPAGGDALMGRPAYIVLIALALITVVAYNAGSTVVKGRSTFTFPGVGLELEDTSGKHFDLLEQLPDDLEVTQRPKKKRPFHVVVTANQSKYNKWQCRVMYYWYKKVKDLPGSEMGGFTRLLHSGAPDDLMDEIPTFVVDPLPPGQDKGYVVLNRPWAFVQWLEQATIEEEYILMAEPDHIFRKALPNLATDDMPAAFPFFYIKAKENEKLLRKFFPIEKGPIANIDPIGNSPVIIKRSTLAKIAPTWHNTSIAMKYDRQADLTFRWVLEMYAYATASAYHGVQHTLRKDFMLQPPVDKVLGENYIIHYTYPCAYTQTGVLTYGKNGDWRFDKRIFTRGAPPRDLPLPPPGVPETVVALVKAVNEATTNIPNWVAGE